MQEAFDEDHEPNFLRIRQLYGLQKDGLLASEWVIFDVFRGSKRIKTSRGAGFEPQLAPPLRSKVRCISALFSLDSSLRFPAQDKSRTT